MRLILGVSGASGVLISHRILQALRQHSDVEIHLIVSQGAERNLELETNLAIADLIALADYHHDIKDMAASISSGSFNTDGMIVAPCSMKSLSGIASGFSTNLLIRAADVCLKEGRKVVLMPREMPLNRIHLRNMQSAAESGCIIIPPMLTFYNKLDRTEDQVDHVIGKVLMQFGLVHKPFSPWQGA